MPLPKGNVKITAKGVEYTSNVERCKYTLKELIIASYTDIHRLVLYRARQKFSKLRGMRKKSNFKFRATFQYWIRKRDVDMQLGIRSDRWYGSQQELGTRNQPKKEILRSTVMENLDEIIKIEALYLSSIEDEAKALGIIQKAEGEPNEGSID